MFDSPSWPAWVLGSALAVATATAGAQSPPIKPGLWEVSSSREVDGKPVASPAANLQNLPPAVRAQVEASMKQKGIAMGGNGANRICMTKETLDANRWQGLNGECKTDYVSRNAASWKWRSVCGQPVASQSEGEAVFVSPESYTIRSTLTMTIRGDTKTTHSITKAKWLANDCGDLRPFAPTKRP